MLSDTTIDRETVQAYLETDYRVGEPAALTLRIGAVNHALAELHRRHGVEASAFLTAWNPYSEPLDDATNRDRQRQLEREVEAQGLTHLPGIGQHPSNQWPGEASCLVLGMSLEAATAAGTRHGQNAVVWCGPDATPQLVLLR